MLFRSEDVLTLAGKNPAFTSGEYYDITAFNVQKGNIPDKVHAFLRTSGEERMLIISGFNNDDRMVKIQLPDEVIDAIGLDRESAYIARDMIWREAEVGFDEDWSFELRMTPFSCFLFKIK